MIELRVERDPTVKDTTLGRLFLDGQRECDTLEDRVREIPGMPVAQWKVAGATAIPAGRYRLERVNSPHFGPDTLSVEGVPGFDLIRIHGGNDDADTHGCILVGIALPDPAGDGGNVVQSRATLQHLKEKLIPRLKAGEEGWIEVRNP